MNFIGVTSTNSTTSASIEEKAGGLLRPAPNNAPDTNHNRLFGPPRGLLPTSLPPILSSVTAASASAGHAGGGSGIHGPSSHDLDALSLFDDIDFSDKPKEITDCLDDLADLIEEKSAKPMLAAVAPTNMMMASVTPKISDAERRRNDAIALLKSLSVPDALLKQLVNESMTGFILVVDAQGHVEFVSESSTENVGHPPQHIQGKTIYNFLHPADHSRFGCHLVQQQSPPTTNTDPDKARRNFTCRFKLQNSESYITLYVACITVRRDQESPETSRLLCVARKLSEVSPHPLTVVSNAATATVAAAVPNNAIIANATDLFTTKLDPATFKVMHADTSPGATSNSRLRVSVAAKTLSMVGKCFLDFCHPEDREVVRGHFQSTVRERQSVSSVYRMTGLIGNNNGSIHQRLNNVVHVQTKSKYHKTVNSGANISTGFIVSIHSIVGDMIQPNSRTTATAAAGSASAAAAAAAAAAAIVGQAAVQTTTTTAYLLATPQQQHQQQQQMPVVMMSSAATVAPASGTKMSTLSTLLSSPSTGTMATTVRTTKASSPPTTSSSPSSENSEEAKNQLLKQLLNSNFQPQTSSSSATSTAAATSTSTESSRIMQLLNSDSKSGVKRQAASPLESPPANKAQSVVCSENPSLTELLEKPPHLSITVPPPVPRQWHQEPREKLPKDIMRKFLPPHPAERAAAAAAAAAAAIASKSEAPNPAASRIQTTGSALYNVLTSRQGLRPGMSAASAPTGSSNDNRVSTATMVYTSNSGQAGTFTSASTSSNVSVYESNLVTASVEEPDDMLSEVLDFLESHEQGPSAPMMTSAAKAEERRISDIERFLVSSEPSLFQSQQQQLPQHQQQDPQHQQQQPQQRPKMSSLAASTPSLTSILSAPPLATPSGRQPQTTVQSNGGPTVVTSNGGGNPVSLMPRMNDLLEQVPPNVSIPDTPDFDSLIMFQDRKRRMSSGATIVTVSTPQNIQQQSPRATVSTSRTVGVLPTGFNLQPSPQQHNNGSGGGGKLMQQLTSQPRGNHTSSMTRSVSFIDNSTAVSGGGQGNLASSSSGPQPQVLARRSSFSGLSPAAAAAAGNSLSSPPPPPGAAAAAAAAAALAAATAGLLQPPPSHSARPLPQRHASGGTVHHTPNLRPKVLQQGASSQLASSHQTTRRLSESSSGEIPSGSIAPNVVASASATAAAAASARSEDKQRSLLQQLLSE